jgi:hypothetical protein
MEKAQVILLDSPPNVSSVPSHRKHRKLELVILALITEEQSASVYIVVTSLSPFLLRAAAPPFLILAGIQQSHSRIRVRRSGSSQPLPNPLPKLHPLRACRPVSTTTGVDLVVLLGSGWSFSSIYRPWKALVVLAI